MSRCIIHLALLASIVALFSVHNQAQAQTAYCWINAATGEAYPSNNLIPVGMTPGRFGGADPNHFHIPTGATGPLSGSNWVRVPGGSWINAATGEAYPSNNLIPVGMTPAEWRADPNHFHIPTGATGCSRAVTGFASSSSAAPNRSLNRPLPRRGTRQELGPGTLDRNP